MLILNLLKKVRVYDKKMILLTVLLPKLFVLMINLVNEGKNAVSRFTEAILEEYDYCILIKGILSQAISAGYVINHLV